MITAHYPLRKQIPGTPGYVNAVSVRLNDIRSAWLKTLFFLVMALFFILKTNGQSACPTSNCTSGDMTITKVEIVDAVTLGPVPNICQPGQGAIPVKLKVTFDATAQTRYGFIIIGDIEVNGQFLTKVWQCYPEDFVQGEHVRILDQVINWPCGSTITLSDVYTAWRHQAPSTAICAYLNSDGTINNCAAIDPKCRYYGEQSFTIASPLIANFTSGGSCGINDLYQPITFTNATTGGNQPYSVSWQIRDAGTNALLATSTNNPYTYTPQSANSLSVTLTITDASTTQQTDSETKTVTVSSCCESPTVSSQPVNQTKCQGTTASFSVNYSGGTPVPTVQWQISTDNGANFSNLTNNATYSGATSLTLNVANVSTSMSGYRYRAVLKSGACSSVQSNSATLTVDQTSVGGSVASPQTICHGTQLNASLTLSGNTGGVTKWQKSTSSNFTSGVTDIASTSTTLSPALVGSLTQDTWIRAVVKNGECAAVNSNSVLITVNALSVGGSVASAQTICYGSQPNSNLTLSGNTGSVVKWQRSTSADFTSGVSDIANTSTTLTAAAIGALTQDTWFRAVVKNGECAEANAKEIKITITPVTVGGAVAADQTICSGNQLNSNLILGGHTGNVVKWQRSTTLNFSAGTTTDIANTTTTLSAAAVGALIEDTWFRAIVKNGVCPETASSPVKITIQYSISGNSIVASQTICSGNAPSPLIGSTPSGGDGNYAYQWQSRTGGGWNNISGANTKDYAPGTLTQTTEFRRVVTAGIACSSHPSASVTISISPESQVFPIQATNFCQSAPNTGEVKLLGSYPGVSYQLKKASDNSNVQDPKIGTGSALVWTGLEAGSYYVYGTGLAPTFCTSTTATVNVRMFDCSVFYTLTQGYYGGKNGKSCIGTNPVNSIRYLLGTTDMTVGSINSITIPATIEGAMKLNQAMPGGSTPVALPAGNCTITAGCFTEPTYLTKQGKINNVLLSQTITLSLNTRWNEGELLFFPIKNGYLTTQKMKGCGDNAILVETCESGTISSILMNPAVVSYLGPDATVANLLQLANDVLGGSKIPGVDGVPSYADVNSAVDCINKSFDEGRRFLNYYETYQTCEMIFPPPIVLQTTATTTTAGVLEATATYDVTVKAYPNPFSSNLNFIVESKKSGYGSLEVYNITGQKIKTVYQGNIAEGTQRFTLTLPTQQRSNLFYILRVGNEKVSGKLLHNGSK